MVFAVLSVKSKLDFESYALLQLLASAKYS